MAERTAVAASRIGRRQLLADFPLTAEGLRLPWRTGAFIFVWLALVTAFGLVVPTVLAVAAAAPLVFPPLGSSAMMIAAQSQRINAHPRAVIIGHGCGIVSGVAVELAFDTVDSGDSVMHLTARHGLAALAAVVACVLLMSLAGVAHAPALSTALMIGLGLIAGWENLLVLMLGVGLLTLTLTLVHRAAGVDYPWWVNPPGPADQAFVAPLGGPAED